jgi:hypothetical protein
LPNREIFSNWPEMEHSMLISILFAIILPTTKSAVIMEHKRRLQNGAIATVDSLVQYVHDFETAHQTVPTYLIGGAQIILPANYAHLGATPTGHMTQVLPTSVASVQNSIEQKIDNLSNYVASLDVRNNRKASQTLTKKFRNPIHGSPSNETVYRTPSPVRPTQQRSSTPSGSQRSTTPMPTSQNSWSSDKTPVRQESWSNNQQQYYRQDSKPVDESDRARARFRSDSRDRKRSRDDSFSKEEREKDEKDRISKRPYTPTQDIQSFGSSPTQKIESVSSSSSPHSSQNIESYSSQSSNHRDSYKNRDERYKRYSSPSPSRSHPYSRDSPSRHRYYSREASPSYNNHNRDSQKSSSYYTNSNRDRFYSPSYERKRSPSYDRSARYRSPSYERYSQRKSSPSYSRDYRNRSPSYERNERYSSPSYERGQSRESNKGKNKPSFKPYKKDNKNFSNSKGNFNKQTTKKGTTIIVDERPLYSCKTPNCFSLHLVGSICPLKNANAINSQTN